MDSETISAHKSNLEASQANPDNNQATICETGQEYAAQSNNIIKKKRGFGDYQGQKTKKIATAIGLITQSNVDPRDAYLIATGKETVHPETIRRLQKSVEKWSLKHPDSLRLASKTIQKFAKGADVNGIIPKDSTVLAAAQRIVDASDPIVKRTENLNVSVDLHPVDLDKYLARG